MGCDILTDMIEKFREKLSTDELIKKTMFGLEWVISADHVSMIRVFDFNIESLVPEMMENYINMVQRLIDNPEVDVSEHDLEIKTRLESMLENGEIVKFKKVILDDVEKTKYYTIDPNKKWGYHGNVFVNIRKVFGRNFDLYLPDGVGMVGYAIYDNDYIILFAPLIHKDAQDDYIDLTVENIKTLDNDALF